jgi:hypothetical protein
MVFLVLLACMVGLFVAGRKLGHELGRYYWERHLFTLRDQRRAGAANRTSPGAERGSGGADQ